MENKNKYKLLAQRQKKYAKTKIALLNALLTELKKKSLSDIMIKQLAIRAEVSEPTFFNYFDSKQDMLVYFIQLWSIDMNAIAKASELRSHSYVSTIKDIFWQTSVIVTHNSQIMLEIIAYQAQGEKAKPHAITTAEKWLYFPELEGVENIEGMGLESILPPLIEKAMESGELDKSENPEFIFLTLSSLFFGTALLVLKDSADSYPQYLEAQINQFLKGLSC